MVVLNRESDTADASPSSGATSAHHHTATAFNSDRRTRHDWFTIACLMLIPVGMMAGAVLGTYVGVIFTNTVLAGLLD